MFPAHLRRGAAAGVVAMALLGPSPGSARIARAAGLGAHPVAAPVVEVSALHGALESAPAPALASAPDTVDAAGGIPTAPPAATVEQGTIQASPPRSEMEPLPGPAPPDRPRFLAGVAMGASIDAGSARPMTFVAPAFASELGFGDGALGFDIRLLSNQASGRAADSAPDRLALDLLLALRPWVSRSDVDLAWGQRVLRALTLTIGLGGERLTAGPASALRAGLVVGARVELPLTAGRDEPGELRLRLAVRRLVGGNLGVGGVKSDDSTEVLAGPVVVF